MNFDVNLDWKLTVALGASVVGIIFAVKISPAAVERVLTHVVYAYRDYAITANGDC